MIYQLFDLFDGFDIPQYPILSSKRRDHTHNNHPDDIKRQGRHLSMEEHTGDNLSWLASHVQLIQYLIHLFFCTPEAIKGIHFPYL